MKSRTKNIMIAMLVYIIIGIVFVTVGYFSLASNMNKKVDKAESQIPYAADMPENAGVLLSVSGNAVFFYLDFEGNSVSVIIPNGTVSKNEYDYCGYPISYRIDGDYQFAAGFIDRLGGLDIDLGDGAMNYSGAQITDMLSRTVEYNELCRKIVTAFFDKVSRYGIERSDLVYIIENCNTDLTVPKCYYWPKYLKELSENVALVN